MNWREKIEARIAELTPYQAIQEMPASVLNEAIMTMQVLLDVAVAADKFEMAYGSKKYDERPHGMRHEYNNLAFALDKLREVE